MATKKAKRFHEGQEVVVTKAHLSHGLEVPEEMTRGVVEVVGRTRVQVKVYRRTCPFYMATGIEVDGFGHRKVWPIEEYEVEGERIELVRKLTRLGVDTWRVALTVDQLRAILTIVEEG